MENQLFFLMGFLLFLKSLKNFDCKKRPYESFKDKHSDEQENFPCHPRTPNFEEILKKKKKMEKST